MPNTHAFCVYGTAELKMNTRFVSNGRKEMSLQLEKRIFLTEVVVGNLFRFCFLNTKNSTIG